MSGPAVRFQLPPLSLFHFPPDPQPVAIPPPVYARTFASLFPISFEVYNAVLDWRVPVTIATLYASTALLLNRYNRSRNYRPWSISKTKSFHYFVLAHNIFLAIFSALTFLGMIRALAHTWPGRRDREFFGKLWPGLRTTNGLAGAADSLCKLHGPKALGDAVFYNPDSHAWMTTNRHVKLSANGTPETSDVGRLWNEGLAFWGWWFYLSKFYEVVDTFIILAKGKPSSTLQTYHHTGAMACMWAGIRYMSPPIWMFCFLNSGVHALMYTYYTLSALRIRVPQRVKSALTTLQISQFLVGIAFASMHLFFHYSVPVSTPYTWTKTVSSVISAASAAATSAASEMASQASAVAEAPGLGLFLQKMLYRALGEEGLARRVGQQFKAKAPVAPQPHINVTAAIERETNWRTQYMFIPCIDTEGQAFAIWLNVFYLAPLTLLFVQFFIRSYFSGPSSSSKPSKKAHGASKASADAVRDASSRQEKPRTTEDGSGHTAEGKTSQRSGSSTPSKGGDRRRVSASIEQMVNNFEKTEAEATEGASKAHGGEYHASSRPPVQDSRSTMHRSLFLETRDYVRASRQTPVY